jgi:hypothetical protein
LLILQNMEKKVMDNKYKAGDHVYALAEPKTKLTVRRYVDKIYYCFLTDTPNLKELVYFERELGS